MKIQKTLFSGKEIVVERTVPTVKKIIFSTYYFIILESN